MNDSLTVCWEAEWFFRPVVCNQAVERFRDTVVAVGEMERCTVSGERELETNIYTKADQSEYCYHVLSEEDGNGPCIQPTLTSQHPNYV